MNQDTQNTVTINIDGRLISAAKGSMLIEVADQAGIPIPRFCYHKHLSIAANCRMCLVEVEKAPKPMPACATPVAEGMTVHTRSDKARGAQKAVMEFLLINHPLDCPICDQGGECELQDLSVAYGKDHSGFTEEKRVVEDKDIGSLIQTFMTRCIQCTRCVRFGDEIANLRELGALNRGENVEITTYVQKQLVSELSGNVIDICPVGALTAKPSKYQARPWEYVRHSSLSIHDGLGTNTSIHTLRGEIARVVPREAELINQVWISDRDRFSYSANFAQDRVLTPQVRLSTDGLQTHSWDDALSAVKLSIEGAIAHYGVDQVGVLVSPSATLEEMYMAQKLVRGLGINNIDHRFQQIDFNDDTLSIAPQLGLSITEISALDSAFLIGADLRMELPVLSIRLRQAVKTNKAQVSALSSYAADQLHDIHQTLLAPELWVDYLAQVLQALLDLAKQKAPVVLSELLKTVKVSQAAQVAANALYQAKKSWIVLGQQAISHPQFGHIQVLANAIATISQGVLGILGQGANAAGAYATGIHPQRLANGKKSPVTALNAYEMLKQPLKAYILVGALDLEYDSILGQQALATLKSADVVIAMTPFANEALQSCATVILPAAAWGETSGSLMNLQGTIQSVAGAQLPLGEARPLWKILRVLGNRFALSGFDYLSSEAILHEWQAQYLHTGVEKDTTSDDPLMVVKVADNVKKASEIVYVPYQSIYQIDAYVRRSPALQQTPLADTLCIFVHPDTAKQLKCDDEIIINDQAIRVVQTDKVALSCLWIPQMLFAQHTGLCAYQLVKEGQ